MSVDGRWLRLGGAADYMRLEGIEFREYQLNITESIHRNGNTLVVLPTGLGKTFIGTSIIAGALWGVNPIFW